MKKQALKFRLKPYSYQPTREELEEDFGISNTTPEELARAILRPVIIEEEPVEQRRPRRQKEASHGASSATE